ncbi:metal ABC transporter substrate-binding protein [Camelimonas fluminis]|uniref:Metal ABC transporter substrate-binding protein n=1 Tax=Camelimonas fluminis TaxID=1576911 RepID=A0ABV7UFE0_9HYPH|nr:metal ABC transporter substrate-binding protein [Camelimonas fluminis]
MRKPFWRRLASALIIALTIVPGVAASASSAAATEHRLKVATTFTILADMARNVAGDHADVVSITRPGAEIHQYQPTPKDIMRARDADLVLNNGLNLEVWFEKFLQHLKGAEQVVVSAGVTPIGIGEGPYNGKPNPHAWMSPAAAAIYVDNIRDALARKDPANAAAYQANAEAYKQKIAAVAAPIRERLAAIPENRRWLATSEGAFSYLARDFGLKEIYLWPINADQQGAPQQVRKVIDAVRQHQIPAVFSENTVSDKPARQVAQETGARYGGVLYVDSLSEPDGPAPTYLDLLKVTASTIADGLSGQQNDGQKTGSGGAQK